MLIALAAGIAGCHSEETKRCVAEFDDAQRVVKELEGHGSDVDKLETSLEAIDQAMSKCREAERTSEVEELTGARNEIAAHLKLVQKKRGPRKPKMTPERLAKLKEEGDPDCPEGQAYKHDGEEIRCTGTQPVNMNLEQAKGYYGRRGYKTEIQEGGKELRAEYGSELFIYRYDQPTRPAKCVVVYPPPGFSWQEATARLTGARPDRLEPGSKVSTQRGEQPVNVQSGEDKLVVRIGQCAS